MIERAPYSVGLPVARLLCRGALMLPVLAAAMLAGQAAAGEFRCPESYATDAERNAAINAFVETFNKEHPQATVGDLAAERHRQLAAHDCRQTLNNIKEHGTVEKIAPQFVLPRTRSLSLAGHTLERVDEYYGAATHVWSVIFVDDPQHPESYSNQLILNFYDWTPKPTAEAVASVLSEPRQGTKNIFLFKSPDEPGGEFVYHVVSLTRRTADFVNLMSVFRWENSAVNISFGHRLGAGTELDKMEAEAGQWLLSPEGEALREAIGGLHVGDGWSKYLKLVK